MKNTQLYEDNIYGNGNLTYYLDKECTKPYTGHVEIYFNEIMEQEFDVINGVRDGIERVFDENGRLELVSQVKDNRYHGFSIEYYPCGRIHYFCLCYYDIYLYTFSYSESGLLKEQETEDISKLQYSEEEISLFLEGYREKYDIFRMNQEILQYGKPLALPSDFEFVILKK